MGFFLTIRHGAPCNATRDELHHRGVIHVNDVIMQCKFLFPTRKKGCDIFSHGCPTTAAFAGMFYQ